MADARFTLEQAIEMLTREARAKRSGLASEAERLAQHLREAFAARDLDVAELAKSADIVHVFDVDTTSRGHIHAGARLELFAYGMQIGTSLVAPPIEPGRYRAVLQLVRLEDEPPR